MSATERAHTAGTYHDKLIVEQENERLRARVKELEAHLLPFARFAEMFDAMPLSQFDNTIYAIHTGTEWEAEIRLSDMRAASATLHKRLGIERADGTVSQEAHENCWNRSRLVELCEPAERVVEIVAVKKERKVVALAAARVIAALRSGR